ncbi:MAG: Heat shock protein Hsp20 [Thermoanaerobacterales bacterium 50_218]|nr:MAG: Heat shock protein Hsp20 [Thermoanaerobacterales bacterium 50_218]
MQYQENQPQKQNPEIQKNPSGSPEYRHLSPFFQQPTLIWQPRIDVFEDHQHILIIVELPGAKVNEINVESVGNILIIKGQTNHPESQMSLRYRERNTGNFYREIPLPPGTTPEKAEARYQNGLLEVKIPKNRPQ